MKFLFLLLLLAACASGHQATIKDATQHVEPQAVTQPAQQPAVQPPPQPAARQSRTVKPKPVKSEQSNPLPQKKNASSIEED